MSTQLIANPTGAFEGGPTATAGSPFDGAFSYEYVDVVNTSTTNAIGAGQIVSLSMVYETGNSPSGSPYVAQFGCILSPVFGTTPSLVFGVALDYIPATGVATGRVMTRGVAPALVDTAGVTANQIAQAGAATSGSIKSVATASATGGINIGIVLANTNTNSNTITLTNSSGIPTAYTVGTASGDMAYIYVSKF